jgi:hypothetical protein
MAREQDGLDPVNYFSVPGLTWDSAFKMTNATVHLLQDSTMYEFFEAGVRGGMTFVNQHHMSRNSPDDAVEGKYNPELDHTELLYVDANNLYGHALSMHLPQHDFHWVEGREECRRLVLEQLPTMNIHTTEGFVAEVDLFIPAALHSKLDALPLAPERSEVSSDMLPTYMHTQLQAAGQHKYHSQSKLLLTHLPKRHYVVHFALLQFYMKMGAVVTEVHRCVRFHQAPFFEPYITFNSRERQRATNELAKEYYKLKNNSLYGKTVENVRGRLQMRLCNSQRKVETYASRPLFQACKKFGPNLVGIQLLHEEVELNKPVYVGQAVLDLSKLVMYQLYYEQLPLYEQRFGGKIRAVGGDTDSLFLLLLNISLRRELLPAMLADGLLDTSNYPPTHSLYSAEQKARLGCIKDEGAGKIFIEWLLLRPKLYSMLTAEMKEHKRAKGIQRCVVANEVRHADYKSVYDSYCCTPVSTSAAISTSPTSSISSKVVIREVRRFRSHLHSIDTISQRKCALTMFEDKRAWLSHNHSVAFGHFSLIHEEEKGEEKEAAHLYS